MKLPFFATLLALIGMAVLCGLGTWQLQRLAWKTEMIAAHEAAATRSAVVTIGYDQIRHRAQDSTDNELVENVFVEGRWLHDKEIVIGPRTWEGQNGYHVITPLALKGGGTLLVNRGWVPAFRRAPSTRPESISDTTTHAVMGMLRRPEKRNLFTPENDPARGQWYHTDIAQMAQAHGIVDAASLILYMHLDTVQAKKQAAPVPDPAALRWQPRNDHLAYALFWFAMAGTLAVIYALRFLRKQ